MSDGIFSAFRVSAMGLQAQRVRLDVTAANLANVETTRTESGEPYRPKTVQFTQNRTGRGALDGRRGNHSSFARILASHARHLTQTPGGNAASDGTQARLETTVVEKLQPFILEFDPTHPDADEEGIVRKPNVDPIEEMMNLMKATRAYEANATALDAAKEMISRGLEI